MSPTRKSLSPRTPARVRDPGTTIARLLARLYSQASPAARAQMLAELLRPVGPLALVTIAAGAFIAPRKS